MVRTSWTSSHVNIRYIVVADLPPIVAMLKKDSVCEHLFFGPNTEEASRAYFDPFIERIEDAVFEGEPPAEHVFSLLHPQSDQFMGTCALLPVDWSHGGYLVGFQLDEPFWGKGYGTWAARFLVAFAFVVLGARRLTADCFATNVGSKRVLEKAGFHLEGAQRSHYLGKDGQPVDNLLFGLLPADADRHQLASWAEGFGLHAGA